MSYLSLFRLRQREFSLLFFFSVFFFLFFLATTRTCSLNLEEPACTLNCTKQDRIKSVLYSFLSNGVEYKTEEKLSGNFDCPSAYLEPVKISNSLMLIAEPSAKINSRKDTGKMAKWLLVVPLVRHCVCLRPLFVRTIIVVSRRRQCVALGFALLQLDWRNEGVAGAFTCAPKLPFRHFPFVHLFSLAPLFFVLCVRPQTFMTTPLNLFNSSVYNVHPVVILSILDHYKRREEGLTRVIGTLMGYKQGNATFITNCFPVGHTETADKVEVEMKKSQQMLDLHLMVHPKEQVLGWYSTDREVSYISSIIHQAYQGKKIKNPVLTLSFLRHHTVFSCLVLLCIALLTLALSLIATCLFVCFFVLSGPLDGRRGLPQLENGDQRVRRREYHHSRQAFHCQIRRGACQIIRVGGGQDWN